MDDFTRTPWIYAGLHQGGRTFAASRVPSDPLMGCYVLTQYDDEAEPRVVLFHPTGIQIHFSDDRASFFFKNDKNDKQPKEIDSMYLDGGQGCAGIEPSSLTSDKVKRPDGLWTIKKELTLIHPLAMY